MKPRDFDLVGLAMQEPQYRSPGVRELLDAVGRSGVPCMSIMNMPPLPYVKRIPNLDTEPLKVAYTDPTVWNNVDPKLMTLCSPDPQAIRPPEEQVNVLQVTLPTNFKVARFDSDAHTAILRDLEKDIDAVRFDAPEGKIELPVKLRVYDSIFVPLAKWSMLLAGNYRCVTADGMRTAQEAVHTNLEESRSVYDFVFDLCVKLGASPNDLVPFEKYAAAAQSLTRPASAARALNNGAPNIERADKLVQLIARQMGLRHPTIDATVALVDARLEANRRKAAYLVTFTCDKKEAGVTRLFPFVFVTNNRGGTEVIDSASKTNRDSLMKRLMSRLVVGAIAAAAMLATAPVKAQDYPKQDIHAIVGFPAGSGADVYARYFANKLSQVAKVNVIVENKPGANSSIATEYVARSKPDGYTIFIGGSDVFGSPLYLFKKPPIDPRKDFIYVSPLVSQGFILTVPADKPYKTVAELTAAMKAKGDKASYPTTNNPALILGEAYKKSAGLNTVQVGYKTSADFLNDMMSGTLDWVWADPVFGLSRIREGKFKPLAISTGKRISVAA